MDLTPGEHLEAHHDGGHYGTGDIIVNDPDTVVVAFYDFTADNEWQTRLFIVPKDKLEATGSGARPHFHIEDCVLGNVIAETDERASFSRVEDRKLG